MTDEWDLWQQQAIPPALKACPGWIILDTETNGLPVKGPADDPRQPRMASLTMIWTTPQLAYVGEKTVLIKPEGWYMPDHVARINKLPTPKLMAEGVPVQQALDLFNRAVNAGYHFAAFNKFFDFKIIRGELRRLRLPDRRTETLAFCVMLGNIGVCKLKQKNGAAKTPKLEECAAHWKIPHAGAHTSAGDAHATLGILRSMFNAGIPTVPTIIKSKEHADG
jgi:DNA polymerase-3 subunit epsilon